MVYIKLFFFIFEEFEIFFNLVLNCVVCNFNFLILEDKFVSWFCSFEIFCVCFEEIFVFFIFLFSLFILLFMYVFNWLICFFKKLYVIRVLLLIDCEEVNIILMFSILVIKIRIKKFMFFLNLCFFFFFNYIFLLFILLV